MSGAGAACRRPIAAGLAWDAADVLDTGSWCRQLSTAQRSAIVQAAKAHVGLADPEALQKSFDLPELVDEVAAWQDALASGLGFLLVRGFPVEELTSVQTELAYMGVGLQLGSPVSQNARGDLLGHVRDERIEHLDPTVRLYQTRERQDFHTDGADIVGLLCLHGAKAGGESRLASSWTVYNRILAERPDLLEVLYQPFAWDRNGEESPGEDPYFSLPVITDVAGAPRLFFIGWYIRDAQRHAAAPRLTAEQVDAIQLIERIANDPSVHVEMDFRPGDLQWLANDRILHCREAYQDADETELRRHLLRLWLAARDYTHVDERLRSGIPRRAEVIDQGAASA